METFHACYGYARVSDDKQFRSHLSLETQEQDCKNYYDAKLTNKTPKIVWGGVYSDPRGVSSKVATLYRPSCAELNRRLKKGDHVVFPKVDRAWRSMRDLVHVLDAWTPRGITIHFASEGIVISESPEWKSINGMMMLYCLTMCAEMERNRLSERQKDANRARRARGDETVGNCPPVGKRKPHKGSLVFVESDSEVAVLQLVRHLREVQGMSLSQAGLLCSRVVTLRNCRFAHDSVRRYAIRAAELGFQPSVRYWGMVPESKKRLVPKEQWAIYHAEMESQAAATQ